MSKPYQWEWRPWWMLCSCLIPTTLKGEYTWRIPCPVPRISVHVWVMCHKLQCILSWINQEFPCTSGLKLIPGQFWILLVPMYLSFIHIDHNDYKVQSLQNNLISAAWLTSFILLTPWPVQGLISTCQASSMHASSHSKGNWMRFILFMWKLIRQFKAESPIWESVLNGCLD